jgi:hypothetical protein
VLGGQSGCSSRNLIALAEIRLLEPEIRLLRLKDLRVAPKIRFVQRVIGCGAPRDWCSGGRMSARRSRSLPRQCSRGLGALLGWCGGRASRSAVRPVAPRGAAFARRSVRAARPPDGSFATGIVRYPSGTLTLRPGTPDRTRGKALSETKPPARIPFGGRPSRNVRSDARHVRSAPDPLCRGRDSSPREHCWPAYESIDSCVGLP